MRQRWSAALTLAVSVATLASCGGGSGSAQGDTARSNPDGVVAAGTLCENEGQTGRGEGPDGEVELICTLMQGDGNLVWSAADGSGPGILDGGSELATALRIPGCDRDAEVDAYTHAFADPAKMSYIYPLGAMTTSHITPVDHIYAYYPPGPQPAGSVGIFSPADGEVVAIEDFSTTNGYPYADHRITIAHSCELASVFIHVGALQGRLAEEFSSGSLREPLKVSGGELLADDSENPNFDFSAFSEDADVQLANQESYQQAESWKRFTAQPFELLPVSMRAAFEAKSLRTEAPFDGTIEWDLPGTARGSWFVEDTNGYRGVGDQTASFDNHGKVAHGYWDTHLAMAPDAVDNSAHVVSIGDWEGCPCQFMSTGNSFDPAQLKVSTTPTVIELVEFTHVTAAGAPDDPARPTRGYRLAPAGPVVGLLAVQLNQDGTMTVEKVPGATSAQAFTGLTPAARTYVR
jgi:hypothetical protein